MISRSKAFSGFAVPDLEAARAFYQDKLGLGTSKSPDGSLLLHLGGGHEVYIYEKPDFAPATYTILNFPVDDIDAAVDELGRKGVRFGRYEGFGQDEKGIFRGSKQGQGPDIAWFTDPAGNIMSVIKE